MGVIPGYKTLLKAVVEVLTTLQHFLHHVLQTDFKIGAIVLLYWVPRTLYIFNYIYNI